MKSFNAEPEQAAGARCELINKWVFDEPRHIPTHFRGLRRRRHLRQPNVLANAASHK
ncbi:MAG: hypothetical protein R3C09_26575 [Pirellulaceae bacterium]